MVLTPYLLFLFSVLVIAFVVLRARKRKEEPATRLIVCPEARMPARVELDARHPVMDFLQGKGTRLRSCSSWPQLAGCEEECLAQIEPQTKIDDILARWHDGKNCAICSMRLVRADWQRGRAAALDDKGNFIPLREMDWTQFPMALEHYQPLCRACHEAQLRQRRAASA